MVHSISTGIYPRTHTDQPAPRHEDTVRLQGLYFRPQRMNNPRVGIQMLRFNQTEEQRRKVCVHQFQQVLPTEEQQHAPRELEHGNLSKTGLVKARRHCVGRLSHAMRKGMRRVGLFDYETRLDLVVRVNSVDQKQFPPTSISTDEPCGEGQMSCADPMVRKFSQLFFYSPNPLLEHLFIFQAARCSQKEHDLQL